MSDNRRKAINFIKCIETEPNDYKVTEKNAIWIPLVVPLAFVPISFIVNTVSTHDKVSKTAFIIAVVLTIIISVGLLFLGVIGKNKAYGMTKAFFGMRVSLSGFVALVPLCSLLIKHFSEEYSTINDEKYISLIVVFFILMAITACLSACITIHMIKKNHFKKDNARMLAASIELLYVPLLVVGKIIGNSDNSYFGFFFMCMIMGYMIFKATYYYLKLHYAQKYKLEYLLPRI